MNGKITLFELDKNLRELISQGASKLMMDSNTVTITNNTDKINIGISTFNQNDQLLVFMNSVFINKNDDYILNNDNSISQISGLWLATTADPAIFNFIVLKNVSNMDTVIQPDGSILLDNSIQENKLSQAVRDKINKVDTGVKEFIISNNIWTQDTSRGLFATIIAHNLNKSILSIELYKSTGEELLVAKKKLDNNRIELLSTVAYDCNLIISY